MRKNKTKSINTWKFREMKNKEKTRNNIFRRRSLAPVVTGRARSSSVVTCGCSSKYYFRVFLYLLPLALVFSYHPVISLGGNETMNFELSLPLIWLMIFDVFSVVRLTLEKKWRDVGKYWYWLLFPIFLTLSVAWSLNVVRGALTVGILWLIYLAGFSIYEFRESLFLDPKFREKFWKWFFGAGLFACLWCVIQCVLDLAGVGRDLTLMCAGCTYSMFGFPHPNGFAIEPQFMGNILLAPAIISAYMLIRKSIFRGRVRPSRRHGRTALHLALPRFEIPSKYFFRIQILFFVFVSSIFLTFSRGAIYAMVGAVVMMVVVSIVKNKNWWSLIVLGLTALSFVFTLNIQGLMAEVSKTDDTYFSGISKVINHLSLGKIKLNIELGNHNIEKNDENTLLDDSTEKHNKESAVFDGYVAESTDTRMRLTNAALGVWSKSPENMIFGVGLGGAGQALYDNGLSPAPKEIIQNEYVSLLLETGLVGILLFIYTIFLVIKVVNKSPNRLMIFALILAYGISLFFFAGLPNALHIYLLLPGIIIFSRSPR